MHVGDKVKWTGESKIENEPPSPQITTNMVGEIVEEIDGDSFLKDYNWIVEFDDITEVFLEEELELVE
jgi:hypothetical protein